MDESVQLNNSNGCVEHKETLGDQEQPEEKRGPSASETGAAPSLKPSEQSKKLFIGNLGPECTKSQLRNLFEQHGDVLECDIVHDYAFVHYSESAMCDKAVAALNGYILNDLPLKVQISRTVRGMKRLDGGGPPPCHFCGERGHRPGDCPPIDNEQSTKVFIGNLTPDCTRSQLMELFAKHGSVVECDIISDYAFVHYQDAEMSDKAVAALNQHMLNGSPMNVQLSLKMNRKRAGMRDAPFEGRGRGRGGYRGRRPYRGRGWHHGGYDQEHDEGYGPDAWDDYSQDGYSQEGYEGYGYEGYPREPPSRYPYPRDPYGRDPYGRDPYARPYPPREYPPQDDYPPRRRFMPDGERVARPPFRDPTARYRPYADPYGRSRPTGRGYPGAFRERPGVPKDPYGRPPPDYYRKTRR